MSAIVIIDTGVMKNCWNPYDSYGEICVHCGCCNKDKKIRHKARYNLCKRMIEELKNFQLWDDGPGWKAIQEKNIKINLLYFKSRMRYYMKRMKDEINRT